MCGCMRECGCLVLMCAASATCVIDTYIESVQSVVDLIAQHSTVAVKLHRVSLSHATQTAGRFAGADTNCTLSFCRLAGVRCRTTGVTNFQPVADINDRDMRR